MEFRQFINKRTLIIGGIGLVFIIGAVSYFLWPKSSVGVVTKSSIQQSEVITPSNQTGSTNSSTVAPPTTQDFYNIIAQNGSLTDGSGNQEQFGITNVKQPLPGWFIVTININMDEGQQIAKTVFRQTGNESSPLTIVTGPAIAAALDQSLLPDAVRNAL